jgi:hypothetical protein
MKTATYTLAAIAIFAAGVTTGVYAGAYKTKREIALDECARYYNVYSCIEKPVPAQAPRVVYKEPELLPPPVEEGA